MATMNISLPSELRDFVNTQVAEGSYTSTSEYLRDLIRRERDIDLLREKLLAGHDSGPAKEIDEAWFEALKIKANSKPFA